MTDQKKPSHEKHKSDKRNGASVLVTLLGILVIAAGVYIYANPSVIDWFRGKPVLCDPVVVETDKHYAQLDAQKRLLEGVVDSLATVRAQLQDIKQEQAHLMDRLQQREENSSPALKLDDNQEKLFKDLFASLEKRLQDFETKFLAHSTLKEGIKDLKARIETGMPFQTEYKSLLPYVSDAQKQALKALEPYKSIGIPPLNRLITEFEEVKQEILKNPTSSTTWVEKFLNRLKSIVSIQKKGEPQQGLVGKLEAIQSLLTFKKAQDALDASRDLKISSPLKDRWEQHAQAYVDGEKALETLAEPPENPNEDIL